MCGIAGFIDLKKDLEELDLRRMTDVMAYRGPDSSGYHFEKIEDSNIGLGHRRLSILDLSESGSQPYYFQDLILIFNGEIYNFHEIRKNLENDGYEFESNSDTEVIIKSYHRKGLDCIEDFIGMFAIVIYDKRSNEIHLIRDRAGVKPLFYYWKNDKFLFASELKAFCELKHFDNQVDQSSITSYFKYSYVTSPHSIYKYVKNVDPGSILTFRIADREFRSTIYWSIIEAYNKPKLSISFTEASERLEELLISSCNYRMIADVPVGIFLSGGYDSTTVTSILAQHHSKKLKTFTIGFENQSFDEAKYAREIADYHGTDHTEHYISQSEALRIVPLLPEIYDEPLGDNSVIPTTLVSQLAKESVTVALSSDAGDEIFAGYPRYEQAMRYSSIFTSPARKFLSSVMNGVNPDQIPFFNRKQNFSTRFEKIAKIWSNNDPIKALEIIMQFNTDKAISKMIPGSSNGEVNYFQEYKSLNDSNDPLNMMLAVDYLTFLLDNNLPKVDRASMSVSLESREPLLDHRLVEFAATLPSNYKKGPFNSKRILKSVLYKYVPKAMMERPKQGFVSPIRNWLQGALREHVQHYLDPNRLGKQGIFDPKEIQRMTNNFVEGKGENAQKIWHLLVFQLWYYRWIEKDQ